MNKKSSSVTVYDVAKLAGISPTTVSRVFNNNYPVAEKTREQVLKAAKTLHYSSKTESGQRPFKMVAVVIPNLQNPFYSALVTGIEQSLRFLNIQMLLVNTNGDTDTEKKGLTAILADDQIGGLIISSVCPNDNHIAEIAAAGIEVVILEQPSQIQCSSVGFNDQKCAELAVRYLIERGCKTIGFISSPLSRSNRRERYQGYLSTLKEHNIPVNQNWIKIAAQEERELDIVYEYKNGKEQVAAIISEGSLPEAFFCGNDITAMGVLAELQSRAIRVPHDVSVIGLDNISYSEMCNPALTTIDQCIYEIGGVAVQILHDNLIDPKRKRINLKMEPKLIVRESVR